MKLSSQSPTLKMAVVTQAVAVLAVMLHGNPSAEAQAQPVGTITFPEGFSKPWGPQHHSVTKDQRAVNLTLDRSSGSGFKSKLSYRNGYFGVQAGNTTGVNTAFYLSNNEKYPGGQGDEIAVEVLGVIPGEPSTLRTNVHSSGTGREMLFHLWFDPAAAFHRYAVLWNPDEVIFLVDDVAVRRYEKKLEATFPEREMWAYGCVWDASAWSTDAADYSYSPFTSRFKSFRLPTAHRRGLAVAGVSYDALRGADQISCSKTTGTESNCRPGGGKPAAHYTRGGTYITQCARNMN